MAEIRRVHSASRGVYGSPRIQAELADDGYFVGRHKVARLMRLARLRGCPKRRFRVTTKRDPSHAVVKDLLKQNFSADTPNQRWVADITYISASRLVVFSCSDGSFLTKDRGLVNESLDESAHRC